MNEDQRGIGDNRPPLDDVLTLRLADDYAELTKQVSYLLASAAVLPEAIADERELEGVSNVIVAMRDAIARAEAARVAEKEPYLRGGQMIDGFFMTIREKLNAARLAVQRRVDEYQRRKVAEERERRRLEAERALRERIEREEEAARLAAEAEQRRLEAERARKPETREAKDGLATAAETEAAAAVVAAREAIEKAEEARIETLRKSSEIARSRFEEGRLVTTRQVGYAEITDVDKLPAEFLWPYVSLNEKARALRTFARLTNFAREIPGASIGKRDEAVVR